MSEAIVMEVSNLKIDWFNEYLEIELLDTNFEGVVATLGEKEGHKLYNVKDRDIISVELIRDIIDKQQKLNNELLAYQNEILYFIEYVFDASFKMIEVSNQTRIDYDLLQNLIINEMSLRKRIKEIECTLFKLASKKIEQKFGEGQYVLVSLHPGGQYAIAYKVVIFQIGSDSHGAPVFRYDLHLYIMKFSNKYTVFYIEEDRVIDTINYSQYINSLNFPVSAIFSENWKSANIQLTNGTMTMDFGRFAIVKPQNWKGLKLEDIIM